MSTDAKRRGNAAYQKRQDALTIRPSKTEGAIIRSAAAAAGMSVQAFILGALRDKIGYDPASMGDDDGADTTGTED